MDNTRRVPLRALLISMLALLVPLAGSTLGAPELGYLDGLLWLLTLVPPFLLAYHRGWRGAATALAGAMAVLALSQVLRNAVSDQPTEWPMLLPAVVGLIAVSLGAGWISELLHQARRKAEELALLDPLTLLPNRRQALLYLQLRCAAAQRGEPLAVVFFDLDRFKDLNDRYGHLAADDVLSDFARVLGRCTRSSDMSARYGGDEFLMIVSAPDAESVAIMVRRVMAELIDSRIGPKAEVVTVSAGIAMYDVDMESPEALLAAADVALYAAKAEGRNGYQVFQRDPLLAEADASAGLPARRAPIHLGA